MFAKIFKNKGVYIAILILSTLILVGVAILHYAISAKFGPMGVTPGSFSGGEISVNNSAGVVPGAEERPAGMPFPEDIPGERSEGFTPPESFKPYDNGHITRNMDRSTVALLLVAVCLLVDIFCVVRLIGISRTRKRRQQKWAVAENMHEQEDERPMKKGRGPLLLLVLIAAAAAAIAQLPDSATDESSAQVEEKLVEATAQAGTITKVLTSGGSISENTSRCVDLTGEIEIESWLVNAGDYVQEGQEIALVDRDTVIVSIAKLTELMAQLDSKIDASRNDVVENAIYAPASGRIKTIYAQPGVDVQDTVREHSALMRLSLDGLMAAQIDAKPEMYAGMDVIVRLSDGTETPGTVERVLDGIASITLSDEKAICGETVSVLSVQGIDYGTAQLYINREIKIGAITGTVDRINVVENMLVGTDIALVVLKNTVYKGEYDILTARRREMEEELTKLFEAYNSGKIYAPCTGRIVAINEDIVVENLSGGNGGQIMLLSSETATMESKVVSVTEANSEGISVEYTENGNTVTMIINLSQILIFKYVDGAYQPCTAAEVAVGDSLVLSYYLAAGENTESVIDHVVLYPAQSQENGMNGTGNGHGGGMTPGGGGGPGGGVGSSGRSSGGVASAGSGAAETEEDPYATSKTILAYITPFDLARIEITVDELDVTSYYVGQPLQVSFDALPGQSFEAELTGIDPNGVNEDGGSTKYTLSLSLDRTADMLTGMNASVKAVVETREAEVVIPLAAVYEEDGEVFVYTTYDKEKDILTDPVLIQTGLSDGTNVEVLSGISSGDRYFYRYAEKIKYSFQ